MIDQATRERWRSLFGRSTSGPWSVSMDMMSVSSGAAKIATMVMMDGHDCALIAQARAGWPLALTELEICEGILRTATESNERLRARVAELESLVSKLHDKAIQANEAERVAMQGRNYAEDARDRALRELMASKGRLATLELATDAWRKHRHSPSLAHALDGYERMRK